MKAGEKRDQSFGEGSERREERPDNKKRWRIWDKKKPLRLVRGFFSIFA